MKILVIGNGFLGKSIIERLDSEGHEVLVFSRRFREEIQCKQIIGNIFDYSNFEFMFSWQPQVVVNTAWVTSHNIYRNDTLNYQYAEFTADLALRVLKSSVEHLVILGSCAEYGPQTAASSAGFTKLLPTEIYGQQKVAAFNSVHSSLIGSKVRLTWARVFQPYGPNQDGARLIPYLIKCLKEGREVEFKNTNTILDWVTTRDIASAISWIINHPAPTEVDIGTSIGYTNIELLHHLEALMGLTQQSSQIVSKPSVSSRMNVVAKDSPLFTSGWLPADTLNSGLEWVLDL